MELPLDDLTVTLPEGRLSRAGKDLDALTELEAGLLAYLADRPGQDVSRDELQREVWGYSASVRSRAVDFTMSRLRRKVEPDPSAPRFLHTVRGAGYRFEPGRATAASAPITPPPDAFVGRAAELERLRALLSGGARLVTVLGLGGVGKTRLALEFLRNQAQELREVAAVDLSGISERRALLDAVSARLGLPAGAGDPSPRIAQRLSAAHTLLLLDDVDALVPVAAELARAWLALPHTRLLVTSRARLRIAGEHVLELGPLSDVAAADLFRVRSEAIRGPLDPDDLGALAPITAALAGWPLALELAAARTRVLRPSALLQRLDPLTLGSRDRDRPERHRTVAAVLGSTVQALDAAERQALIAVSLLPHGTPLDALDALLPERDPVEAVAELADRALVRVDERHGEARIVTLGLVARFVIESAPQAELLTLRQRCLAWAAAHAEAVAEHIRAGRAWRESLDAERANVHAVWSGRQAASRDAARLGIALVRWWIVRGSWEGLHGFAAEVLADARATGSPELVHEAMLVHINASRLTGHGDEALVLGDALASSDAPEPTRREAAFLVGAAHRRLGQPQDAVRVLAQVAAGADLSAARASTVLALVHDVAEQPARALAAAEHALHLVEQLGADSYVSNTAVNLAVVLRRAGQLDRARSVLARAADTFADAGSPRLEASILHERGQVEVDAGRLAEAEAFAHAELQTLRRHGDRAGAAWPLGNLGVLAAEQGNLPLARERLDEALREHERAGHRAGVIATWANQGIVHLLADERDAALLRLRAARAEAEAVGFRRFNDVLDAFIEVAEGRWTDRPIAGPPQDVRLLRRAAERFDGAEPRRAPGLREPRESG